MYLKRIYKFKNVGCESAYLIHIPPGGGYIKIFAVENLIRSTESDHICFLVALHIFVGFYNKQLSTGLISPFVLQLAVITS